MEPSIDAKRYVAKFFKPPDLMEEVMAAHKALSAIAIAVGLSCAAIPAFPATPGASSELANSIGNLGLAAVRVEAPNNGHSVKPPLDGDGIVINVEPARPLYARPPVVREAPAPVR